MDLIFLPPYSRRTAATDRAPGQAAEPIGWTEAPEELKAFNPTELEEHMRLVMQGPDPRWMANHHQAQQQRAPLPDSTPELARRKEVMHEVDSDPALQHVAEAEGLLGCYLRNRVRARGEPEAILTCGMGGAAGCVWRILNFSE